MSWLEVFLFIILFLAMLFGLIATFLPAIPGLVIIYGAIFLFALITGFKLIGYQTLIVLGILTAISIILDWLAAIIGVKKMGGSIWGMIGALLGMIVGLIIPGIGVFSFIIFAFIGAFLFEWLASRQTRTALKAGFGSFIGFLAGSLMKFVIGLVMIGVFIWQVLF
jgi:uncharacterized protein YqgC (DUF456 family)